MCVCVFLLLLFFTILASHTVVNCILHLMFYRKERNSEEISGTLFRESTPSIRNSVIGRRGSVEKRLQPTEENSYAIELLYILKVTSDICGVGM